jgi:hypothetical protein
VTLSERAETLLSFITTLQGSAACENCSAAYLGIDRYDALKVIRELVLAGRILCGTEACAVCDERRLVARLRRERRLA